MNKIRSILEEKQNKEDNRKRRGSWKSSSFKSKADKAASSPSRRLRNSSELSRAQFCMGNFRENSARNTVPSDADSRATTFLIRHARKIYFQSLATEREEEAQHGTNGHDDDVRVRLCSAAGGGEATSSRKIKGERENDQLAWPAAAATTSGITLIRVKKRNFPWAYFRVKGVTATFI